MFLCSWPTALITFAAVFTLFMVVKYRKPRKDITIHSRFQIELLLEFDFFNTFRI